MARRGKDLQIGGGSRRPSQAKAEDAARRSRKRASRRLAVKLERQLEMDIPIQTIWKGR